MKFYFCNYTVSKVFGSHVRFRAKSETQWPRGINSLAQLNSLKKDFHFVSKI